MRCALHKEDHLLPTLKEEFVRIDSVCYSTSNEWYPVENDRWFMRFSEPKLVKDIADNRQYNEGGKQRGNDQTCRLDMKSVCYGTNYGC